MPWGCKIRKSALRNLRCAANPGRPARCDRIHVRIDRHPAPIQENLGSAGRCVNAEASELKIADGGAFTLIGTCRRNTCTGSSRPCWWRCRAPTRSLRSAFLPCGYRSRHHRGSAPAGVDHHPVHLRTLLASGIAWPPLDLVVSATARCRASSHTRRRAAAALRCWRSMDQPKLVRSRFGELANRMLSACSPA